MPETTVATNAPDPSCGFSFIPKNYTDYHAKLWAALLTLHGETGNMDSHGLVAHECILDLRAFKATTAEDVAKRLMDYGFHAPTLLQKMFSPDNPHPVCDHPLPLPRARDIGPSPARAWSNRPKANPNTNWTVSATR